MFTSPKTGGQFSSLKGTRKMKRDAATSRSFLQSGSALREINSARLSLCSTARTQKIGSNSLSSISEKDVCTNSDFENYELEYSTYLLRKLQNKLLAKDKEEKECNVKKCFISLKWEYEELINKNIKLKEDIAYFKMYFETIEETNKRIQIGKSILDILREKNFEVLLNSLSDALDYKINQLRLVDFDKALLEEAFRKGTLGEGSEIDECLKKINHCIKKNKNQISNIADKVLAVKRLCLENSVLRERCYDIFKNIADEFLEARYEEFTGTVLRAFKRRQESCLTDLSTIDNDLFSLDELLKCRLNVVNDQQADTLSKIESPCNIKPNSSSTPQPN